LTSARIARVIVSHDTSRIIMGIGSVSASSKKTRLFSRWYSLQSTSVNLRRSRVNTESSPPAPPGGERVEATDGAGLQLVERPPKVLDLRHLDQEVQLIAVGHFRDGWSGVTRRDGLVLNQHLCGSNAEPPGLAAQCAAHVCENTVEVEGYPE
jgi:hypothetical protein